MTLAPTESHETGVQCPYPGCGRSLRPDSSGFCACEYRDPVVVCGSCGVVCPGRARYCRGCRAALPPIGEPDCRTLASAPRVEFLFVPGIFHGPPLAHRGFLWCLAADGQVMRLSLAPDAHPREWASMGSQSAGSNRYAIVDASFRGTGEHRPMLLAIDPEAVWSLPLAEHQASVLYRPPRGQEIVANRTAAESILFRGLAAANDAYAFLLRSPGTREAVMAIRYFNEDRAGEQPIRISGTSFLGPVMEDGLATVCSEDEVWVYRNTEQAGDCFEFKNFAPMFSRSSGDLAVLLGVTPLWAGTGDRGLEARIAGTRDGQTGWLRVFFDRHYDEFMPLPKQACISRADPSGLCVNLLDTVEFLGVDQAPRHYGNLEPGMPVACSGSSVAYWNRVDSAERHELTVFAGVPLGLEFEDRDSNANTCCGFGFSGPGLVVSYIVPLKPKCDRGMRIAHWRLRK